MTSAIIDRISETRRGRTILATDNIDWLRERGWKWSGMGYRPNGDGYANFRHVSGRRATVGAGEAGWSPDAGGFKAAALRAFVRRLERQDGPAGGLIMLRPDDVRIDEGKLPEPVRKSSADIVAIGAAATVTLRDLEARILDINEELREGRGKRRVGVLVRFRGILRHALSWPI